MSLARWYGVDEVYTRSESIPAVIDKFEDVFDWPETLPPRRSIERHIHLKGGTDLVNVRPYRRAYHQKEEMLTSGIICPSTSPYSSLVLLVKKKDGGWRFCVDHR